MHPALLVWMHTSLKHCICLIQKLALTSSSRKASNFWYTCARHQKAMFQSMRLKHETHSEDAECWHAILKHPMVIYIGILLISSTIISNKHWISKHMELHPSGNISYENQQHIFFCWNLVGELFKFPYGWLMVQSQPSGGNQARCIASIRKWRGCPDPFSRPVNPSEADILYMGIWLYFHQL